MWECMDNHIAFIPPPSIFDIMAIFVEINSEGLFTWRWGTPDRSGNMWWVTPPIYHINVIKLKWEIIWTGGLPLGLSRLCSATFEQLLAFGATFCDSSNREQILPFWATLERNIGLAHISSTKKSTISRKTSIFNFFKIYLFSYFV